MAKHTVGYDPAMTFGEASAYALDVLRDRGDIPPGKRYTLEDGTTDEHRNNPDGAEAVIVVRVED